MKPIRYGKTTSLVLVALLGLSSAMAQAAAIDPAGVEVKPEQQNGITFLNGGIGKDEADAIRATKGYNFKMTFATGPGNAFVSDVDVGISTRDGKQVLALNEAGPLVYVKLPTGDYDVTASSGGQTQRRKVAIRAGREVSFQPSGDSDIAASSIVGEKQPRMTARSARAVNFHWNKDVN
jgi:hypothetical protein